MQGQVEAHRRGDSRPPETGFELRPCEIDSGLIVIREAHLEHRMTRHVANRGKLGNQLLERQILMRIGFQRRRLDLLLEAAEAVLRSDLCVQRQIVDEESDHAFQRAVAPTGNR